MINPRSTEYQAHALHVRNTVDEAIERIDYADNWAVADRWHAVGKAFVHREYSEYRITGSLRNDLLEQLDNSHAAYRENYREDGLARYIDDADEPHGLRQPM